METTCSLNNIEIDLRLYIYLLLVIFFFENQRIFSFSAICIKLLEFFGHRGRSSLNISRLNLSFHINREVNNGYFTNHRHSVVRIRDIATYITPQYYKIGAPGK